MMSDSNMQNLTFYEFFEATGKINFLEEKVNTLEAKLTRLETLNEDSWLTLAEAAKKMGKSASAVRQRLKHPKKTMPKGIVWKQESLGCEIFVNLKNYKKYV